MRAVSKMAVSERVVSHEMDSERVVFHDGCLQEGGFSQEQYGRR